MGEEKKREGIIRIQVKGTEDYSFQKHCTKKKKQSHNEKAKERRPEKKKGERPTKRGE